jgi:hypothetical protein
MKWTIHVISTTNNLLNMFTYLNKQIYSVKTERSDSLLINKQIIRFNIISVD